MLKNGSFYSQAVTVQEGDSNLITRIRRSSGQNFEIRQEFSPQALKYVRYARYSIFKPYLYRKF